MKRFALACLLLLGCTTLPACARQESLVDVQVIDRETGNTLPHYLHYGKDFLEGQPGHHFTITLQNLTGERVLAVVSVDGVNAISGQTAGAAQAGYVLDPWQRVEVAGWRKSYSEVAEFFFTDLPDSYAARTGRPENVGVIGVAAFRERHYEPVPYTPPEQPMPMIGRAENQAAPAAKAADAMASGAAAPYAERRDGRLDNNGVAAQGVVAQELGTGHGERRYDPVAQTQFERDSSRPNQVVSYFYDSYEALVAKGIRPSRDYASQPEPFPLGFVPDPGN
jgi:hypothetical protein